MKVQAPFTSSSCPPSHLPSPLTGYELVKKQLGEQKVRTNRAMSPTAPKWNETVMLNYRKQDTLTVAVWARDVFFDKFLGSAEVVRVIAPSLSPASLYMCVCVCWLS